MSAAGIRLDPAQSATLHQALDPSTVDYPKSTWQIFLEFLKTKDFPKIFSQGTLWAGQVVDLSPGVKNFGTFAGDVKNFMSAAEIPGKLAELGDSVSKAFQGPSLASGRHVIKKGSEFVNSVADGIKLVFGRFAGMALKPVEAINFGSTVIGCGNGAIEDIEKIKALPSMNSSRTWVYLLNLGRDLSYVGVGSIGLASLAMGVTPPLIMLACLTSALVCSIGAFFGERMVDPVKSQDQEKANAQLRARMATAQQIATAGAVV